MDSYDYGIKSYVTKEIDNSIVLIDCIEADEAVEATMDLSGKPDLDSYCFHRLEVLEEKDEFPQDANGRVDPEGKSDSEKDLAEKMSDLKKNVTPVEGQMDSESPDDGDEEDEIEVRTPAASDCLGNLDGENTSAGESASSSEFTSKSTSCTFLDDSLLTSSQHPESNNKHSEVKEATITDEFSDLEDETPATEPNTGGGNDNKAFEIIDSSDMVDNSTAPTVKSPKQSSPRTVLETSLSQSDAETFRLLDEHTDIEFADDVEVAIDETIEVQFSPVENFVSVDDPNNEQSSLIDKHEQPGSLIKPETVKMAKGICSTSDSLASSSSSSSRISANRMVKLFVSGKAAKSISKKITKLFKK